MAAVSAAILGIDFGQQFTKAVLLAPGVQFELVLTDEGKRKDLSGLSVRPHPDAKGELERVYGSATGSLCTRFPQSCILNTKALIGKSIDDPAVASHLHLNFVKLLPDELRSNAIKVDVGIDGENFTVEEVIAMALGDIKQRALNDLEDNPRAKAIVDDVAISIPPFATQQTRQAYLDSLKLANFSNILGLVDEGTAVALNYVSNKKFTDEDYSETKEYHLAYDMGAGSTKATLFSYTPFANGTINLEIEAIGYDESFGGQLFTKSIYTIILEKFLLKFGLPVDTELPAKVRARLFEVAEKAKIVLSVNADYHVLLESIYNEKDFKTTVSREEFEEFNSDLLKRITTPIFDAVEGHVLVSDLKSIVLSGGSTRVPFVQKHLITLVGEEKISKNVNADESCALGTTARGFKWKTHLEKAKDIKVIDKSFHNFEINVNGVESLVFPVGATIGNSTKINLSNLSNSKATKDYSISLLEDGKLLSTFNIDGLTKKAEKLKCKKDETQQLYGTFSLNHNKIFSLNSLELGCLAAPKKGGLFKNLLKKEVEEVEEVEEVIAEEEEEADNDTVSGADNNGTNKTSNKAKPKTSTILRSKSVNVIVPKPEYAHVKPLSNTVRDRIGKKLALWNNLDEARFELDQIKNLLEGQLYELRSFIDDNEETFESEISDVSSYTSFVSELVEWLEFDSDGSSIEDIRSKIKDVNTKKKELDRVLEMKNTDLSFDGMKKIYEEGSNMVMAIQGFLIEYGEAIRELREKFENEGFDFDKENDKIKYQLLSKSGGKDKMLSLDKNLADYKNLLTEVGEIVGMKVKQFNKLTKEELFEVYDKISLSVVDMLSDIQDVELNHKQRIASFESKFKLLKDRKTKKELRDKLKEEQAKAKKEETAEEEEEVDREGELEDDEEELNAGTGSTTQTSSSTFTIEDASETEVNHDEL